MRALVVVDMMNEFVSGARANPPAAGIVEPIASLLAHARSNGWVVAFVTDAHHPDDRELELWGRHSIAGTDDARVIDALAPELGEREFSLPKRYWGGFDGTGLDQILRNFGVEDVVITGQATNYCVRYTCYGAFVRGYRIEVPIDAVCAGPDDDHPAELAYLRDCFAARLGTTTELLANTAPVGG